MNDIELIQILSDFLNGRKSDVNTISDCTTLAEDIFISAKSHQVEPILYYQTHDPHFEAVYSKAVSAYANRIHILKALDEALTEAHISYYLVKGPVVAAHYPVPALRTMGDCDVIVHSSDRESVGRILAGLGFVNKSNNDDHEWTFFKGDISSGNEIEIELHDALLYYDAINSDAEMEFVKKHWSYARNNKLDKNFHFVYLLIHLKKHFLYEGVGFRQFMDVAVEIKKGDLDWSKVNAFLEEAGLTKFAGICFGLIKRWFGIEVPFSELITDDFYINATEKILNNGVFGFDDSSNSVNNKLNRVRRNGKLHSFIANLFPSYKDCRYVPYYSFVNGRPYLLPIVWLYRFYRTIKYGKVKDGTEQLKEVVKTDLSERDRMLKSWGL